MLGGAHGRCSWGDHSIRYGTSYVSRHCIRIGTVLEQLNGGTATRVADAADAADADFIVPHAARTHTSHAQGPRLGARTCLPLLSPTHCSSLSLSLSSRSSGRSAACGTQCARRHRCRTSPAARNPTGCAAARHVGPGRGVTEPPTSPLLQISIPY